jgi:hypothetical protein
MGVKLPSMPSSRSKSSLKTCPHIRRTRPSLCSPYTSACPCRLQWGPTPARVPNPGKVGYDGRWTSQSDSGPGPVRTGTLPGRHVCVEIRLFGRSPLRHVPTRTSTSGSVRLSATTTSLLADTKARLLQCFLVLSLLLISQRCGFTYDQIL